MKKRSFLSLVLALLLTAFPFQAFAAESVTDILDLYDMGDLTILYGSESGITPYYEPVCGTYAYHEMMSSGWGWVYKLDKTPYIEMGCAWQCTRCLLVMVTEGDLYWWGMDPIGKYATYHGYVDPINKNGCFIYGADHYGYTTDNYLSGYKFVLPSV